MAPAALAAPPKPCDLLTPQQVQTLTGGSASAGKAGPVGGAGSSAQCEFSAPGTGKSVVINYIPTASLHLPSNDAFIASMKQNSKAQAISGLGDFATFECNINICSTAVVYHGFFIGLDLQGGHATDKEAMVGLTRQVLSKF